MIEIKNLSNETPTEPFDFRIDRTSPVGNPFRIQDETERDAALDAYETYFEEQLAKGGEAEFTQYIAKMKLAYKKYDRLRLFCWCAPRRCHGETIKRHLLH